MTCFTWMNVPHQSRYFSHEHREIPGGCQDCLREEAEEHLLRLRSSLAFSILPPLLYFNTVCCVFSITFQKQYILPMD